MRVKLKPVFKLEEEILGIKFFNDREDFVIKLSDNEFKTCKVMEDEIITVKKFQYFNDLLSYLGLDKLEFKTTTEIGNFKEIAKILEWSGKKISFIQEHTDNSRYYLSLAQSTRKGRYLNHRFNFKIKFDEIESKIKIEILKGEESYDPDLYRTARHATDQRWFVTECKFLDIDNDGREELFIYADDYKNEYSKFLIGKFYLNSEKLDFYTIDNEMKINNPNFHLLDYGNDSKYILYVSQNQLILSKIVITEELLGRVIAPEMVFSGEEFDIKVGIKNIGEKDLSFAELKTENLKGDSEIKLEAHPEDLKEINIRTGELKYFANIKAKAFNNQDQVKKLSIEPFEVIVKGERGVDGQPPTFLTDGFEFYVFPPRYNENINKVLEKSLNIVKDREDGAPIKDTFNLLSKELEVFLGTESPQEVYEFYIKEILSFLFKPENGFVDGEIDQVNEKIKVTRIVRLPTEIDSEAIMQNKQENEKMRADYQSTFFEMVDIGSKNVEAITQGLSKLDGIGEKLKERNVTPPEFTNHDKRLIEAFRKIVKEDGDKTRGTVKEEGKKLSEDHVIITDKLKRIINEIVSKTEQYEKENNIFKELLQQQKQLREKFDELLIQGELDQSGKIEKELEEIKESIKKNALEQNQILESISDNIINVLENQKISEDKFEDMFLYIKEKHASDWERIKGSVNEYKQGKIGRGELLKRGLKGLGKKFLGFIPGIAIGVSKSFI